MSIMAQRYPQPAVAPARHLLSISDLSTDELRHLVEVSAGLARG